MTDVTVLTLRTPTALLNKYFKLKKTRGAPIGRSKLKLLASNGVHICHAI